MKTWTVVLEINDDESFVTKEMLEEFVSGAISGVMAGTGKSSFRIMETIPAPYGPQHPGGVFIAEMKCICRKGSSFVNPNCKAEVHHP